MPRVKRILLGVGFCIAVFCTVTYVPMVVYLTSVIEQRNLLLPAPCNAPIKRVKRHG